MSSFGQMFKQTGQLYNGLSLGQKISFFIFLIIGVSAFVTLVMVAKQPDYRLYQSNLSAQDMNEVVSFLKENRVEYKITQGGSAISIPSSVYYDTKMAMAGAGLPQGGATGFEIFDGKTLGMTDFQQSVNYQRALQGELARTITQLAGVEACRVHLVLPKETLFKEDQNEPTASVALKLKKSSRLSLEQVDSIVFLVSGSVEGLDPSHISVIDAKGKILSKRRSEDVAGPVNSAMLDYKSKLEMEMEKSIVALLAKSVGTDKVAVEVSADVDFRQVSTTKEYYDPESAVPRSERVVNEKTDSNQAETSGSSDSGVGINANLPDDSGSQEGSQSSSKVSRRTETINYELTREVSQINEPVGEIKGLSIAVMIDGTYEKKDGKLAYKERSAKEMQKFTSLVKRAIGYNADRGDTLEVLNIPFKADESFSVQAGSINSNKELIFTVLNHSLVGLGLLLFVFFVIRPLVKWLTAEPAYDSIAGLAGMLPSGVVELEEKMLLNTDEQSQNALPPSSKSTNETHEESRMKELMERRDKIMVGARKDKKAIAAILRKWMQEEN